MKYVGISIISSILLSSCATTSDVLPLGPDTYRVIASRDNFRGGAVGAQQAALTAGQSHCVKLGKEFIVTNTASSITPPHHNNFTVTFRCLNKGDKDLARPNLQQTPNIVIEDRRQ